MIVSDTWINDAAHRLMKVYIAGVNGKISKNNDNRQLLELRQVRRTCPTKKSVQAESTHRLENLLKLDATHPPAI